MKWADAEERLGPTSIAGACALFFSFAVHCLHVFYLPLVVPPEGSLYYFLSTLPGSGHLFSEFNYAETPLYPLLLRGTFDVLGENARAVLILNSVFSFLTVVLVAQIVRVLAGIAAAVLSVMVLSLWPLSIVYQHTFLAEAGSMFMLSLVASTMLTFMRRPRIRTCVMLSLCLTVAYYFRPTFLWFAPLCSSLGLFARVSARNRPPPFTVLMVFATAITAIPWAFSSPWRMLGSQHLHDRPNFVRGLIDQAVVRPSDSRLGSVAPMYAQALLHARELSRERGELELNASGLRDSDVGRIMAGLPEGFAESMGPSLRSVIGEEPRRYFYAWLRTLRVFLGAETFDSENDLFAELVLNGQGEQTSTVLPGVEAALRDRFSMIRQASWFQRLLHSLYSGAEFRRVLLMLNTLSFVLLCIACVRRDLTLVIVPAFIFAFYFVHALLLLSSDRWAFPAYSLVIAAGLILPARALRWVLSPIVFIERRPLAVRRDRRLLSLLEIDAIRETAERERTGGETSQAKKR